MEYNLRKGYKDIGLPREHTVEWLLEQRQLLPLFTCPINGIP